ncbi:head-tail connector protein [Hoeflea sp. YIM 152468]|uniref:head-tail connector protein n=1 Tax=Hoeflea sp. YIM 152468 TaxID=3031759 RepID=UPI0023DAD1AB|nr:head-tail connector protein [Hoeflea sp. YIM 152468]MDF1607281.1 head-tail connector protein [Hoeflea sp. YIM 152468]
MTLIQTDPPLAEPVTLAEVKAHLRIDASDEDDLLEGLIRVARAHLEAATGMALMSQSFRLVLDDWPRSEVIPLMRTPVQTVDAILLYDADGVEQNLDLSGLLLDGTAHPARLVVRDRTRPSQPINGIEIEFTAGFNTAAEVPPELKRAILIHSAHLYEFRGAVTADMQPASIPAGYDRLIGPWQRRAL